MGDQQLTQHIAAGPVNTWSRTAYLQPSPVDGRPSLIPEWNRIESNFIMVGPKFGALYGPDSPTGAPTGPCSNGSPERLCHKGGGSMFTCLDHDDGSDYYIDTNNVCVFAGMKNYLGQNKIWDSNLIVYAEGATRQNRSGMPGIWSSMNMAGNHTTLPCAPGSHFLHNVFCRNRETFTNNTVISHGRQPLEFDMFSADDLKTHGPRNTTMPFTAYNTYRLGVPYAFGPLGWDLSSAQSHGIDLGSTVSPEPMVSETETMARQWLGLPFAETATLPSGWRAFEDENQVYSRAAAHSNLGDVDFLGTFSGAEECALAAAKQGKYHSAAWHHADFGQKEWAGGCYGDRGLVWDPVSQEKVTSLRGPGAVPPPPPRGIARAQRTVRTTAAASRASVPAEASFQGKPVMHSIFCRWIPRAGPGCDRMTPQGCSAAHGAARSTLRTMAYTICGLQR